MVGQGDQCRAGSYEDVRFSHMWEEVLSASVLQARTKDCLFSTAHV